MCVVWSSWMLWIQGWLLCPGRTTGSEQAVLSWENQTFGTHFISISCRTLTGMETEAYPDVTAPTDLHPHFSLRKQGVSEVTKEAIGQPASLFSIGDLLK